MHTHALPFHVNGKEVKPTCEFVSLWPEIAKLKQVNVNEANNRTEILCFFFFVSFIPMKLARNSAWNETCFFFFNSIER